MKVCIVGAGAVGGHIAALMANTGAQVSALVRGANLEAIRANGLTVHGDDATVHADSLRASSDPHDLGPQDAVLVTTKSYALAEVAPAIAALLRPGTPVAFLQNGIPWWYFHRHEGEPAGRRVPAADPGGSIWDTLGPQCAVGGTTTSNCTLLAPGVVKVTGGNRLMVLGEPDGTDSPRVRELGALLREAGFPVECTTRIRDQVWTKLALALGASALGLLAPVPLKDLFAEQACIDARFRVLAEVAAIAQTMGHRVSVDLAASTAFVRNSPHMGSIVQDMLAGRRLEIDTMMRCPLEMARERGVSTPTLDLLVALAVVKARGAGQYP